MTTLEATTTEDILRGLSLIDCDAHFTEPPDLWTSRAAKSMQDRVPVMRTDDGVTSWYLDGRLLCGIGGNTLRHGHEKQLGLVCLQPWDDIDEASWDVSARLGLLDSMGVYAQILYPNGLGFASNTMFSIADKAQRSEIQRIYNDFLMDVQHESAGRLFPQAVLPVWDMDLTLREMVRLRDQGARGFTLSDKPHKVGLPELDSPYFAPMWALGNEMGAVFNFHIGSGTGPGDDEVTRQIVRRANPAIVSNPDVYWESFGPQRRLAIMSTTFYMSNVRIISNMCMSDIFDRYPNLRICSAESGIGWIPFILESLEYQLDEMVNDPAETTLQKRRPSEYFHDHFHVMFWYERSGPQKLIDEIGVNNILVETDVPHPTCIYPGIRQKLAKTMAGFDAHTCRRLIQDNAAELYGIALPEVPATD